ncbi:hypothetical protein MLD38_002375 [Melastoma candidum]|uniref:Uncharacterized protein n=1 Tax=Melastoma candidum TaxID=119954 RepID=A0ACB9RZ48_9MYRT|nr:hypothetical protein MLD38_002375 [Melastoma candidum]
MDLYSTEDQFELPLIAGVSLAAAIMSLSYSVVAWVASVHKGKQPGVEYTYKASTKSGAVLNFFSTLGDVAFAYAGHNVVLEIQATIPSTPKNPSKKPMWRGVIVAYITVALCYFPVALVGCSCYYQGGFTSYDSVGTLQFPLVFDSGAAGNLHLYVCENALPSNS